MAFPTIDAIVDTTRWVLIFIYMLLVGSYVYTVDTQARFAKSLQDTCDYPLEKDTVRSRLYAMNGHLSYLYNGTTVVFVFILITTFISRWQAYLASNADIPAFTRPHTETTMTDRFIAACTVPLKSLMILIVKDRAVITIVTIIIIILQRNVIRINKDFLAVTRCYQSQSGDIDAIKEYLPVLLQT